MRIPTGVPWLVLAACSSSPSTGAPDTSLTDAASVLDAASPPDAASGPDASSDASTEASPQASLPPPTACSASGTAAIVAPAACWLVAPTEAGASATGENASVPSYALAPDPKVQPRRKLAVFLNGSGGHPSGPIASPQTNFYDTAASLGYAVVALSYASQKSVGSLCQGADACFFPTRRQIILGVSEAGSMANVAVDASIAGRLVMTLTYLAAHDPAGGWADYLVGAPGAAPETRLAWPKLVVAGHSQGGGHAAAMGKLFPVARVVQLSAPCDHVGGTTPATWTNGSAGAWASDPTQFYGLGAPTIFTNGAPTGGDTTCAAHAASWQNLGMVPERSNDTAATCGATGDTHGASIKCVDNAAAWANMLN